MALVTVGMSMSLDGFVAGPNVSLEHPMGEGGERLHNWLFSDHERDRATGASHKPGSDVNAAMAKEMRETTGAVILGRRTFDVGIDQWGDVPYPVPNFVLTHQPKEPLAMSSGVFTFVNDGIESALRLAVEAAGERKIMLMGAEVTQQFLNAGLLDEIQINLVPVLFGKGQRLFEDIVKTPVELQITRVLAAEDVTHLIYRVTL